ncbi:MAG: DUF5018 domain-containing protein, partial [Bacteroidales bacterium]|nr:DUF5018 domain-containing protein [Bacteroidales bacterium]
METAAEPVSLASLSVPTDIVTNQEAEITLVISATASAEEIFYLRYTNDNWASSALTTFSMAGTTGTATIPGQAEGKTINYYAFSSTVSGIGADYDLYTIKMANNGGLNYSYTVAGLSSDAEILTFTLTDQTGNAVINSAAATVDIEVTNGTALTNLTPTISLSPNATISPASGIAQDFSSPVEYTVTAEDLTEKVWTVTVTEAAPPAPNYGLRDDGGTNLPTITYWYSGQAGDITEKGSEFDGKALGELTALYIKGANIKSWKSAGGDVSGATFSYKIWESTAAEPSVYTEKAVNWSSDDGDGNQTWSGFGAEIEAAS